MKLSEEETKIMKEEYFKDLANFQEAVRKYVDWMEANEIGLMSWWEGAKRLYEEINKAKAELDLWHL